MPEIKRMMMIYECFQTTYCSGTEDQTQNGQEVYTKMNKLYVFKGYGAKNVLRNFRINVADCMD